MHDKTHLCTHATNPLFNTRLLNLDEVTTKKTISSIYGETFGILDSWMLLSINF